MQKCKKCGEYTYVKFGDLYAECQCEPFIIINEDGDEYEIFSTSDHEAALKYAEKSNTENDYYLMNESIEIEVNGKKFNISAEPDVYYSASEAKATV